MIQFPFYLLILLYILIVIIPFLVGKYYYKYALKTDTLFENSNQILVLSEYFYTGILICTSLIAVIRTQFLTVQIFLFFIFLFSPFFNKIHFHIVNEKPKIYRKVILLVFIIFLVHFYFYTYLADHVFYAKLSSSIFLEGKESTGTLYKSYLKNMNFDLYHYSDLWLSGFVSWLTGVSNLFVLTKVIYPLFHLSFFISIWGIVISISKKHKGSFIVTFLILYGTVILFTPLLSKERGHGFFWFYGIPDLTSFKSLVVYSSLALMLFSLDLKKWALFFVLALIACIQNFVLVLPIVLGSISLLIYLFVIKKEEDKAYLKFGVIFLFLILLLLKMPDSVAGSQRELNLFNYIHPLWDYFKNSFNYLYLFSDYFSRSFFAYPFFLVLFFLLILTKKDSKIFLLNSLVFIIFSFIGVSAFISLFFEMRDVTQTISIFIPVAMIYLTLKLFFMVENRKVVFFLKVSFALVLLLNVQLIFVYRKPNIKLSKFENSLYLVAKSKIKDNNWAYYSKSYWSIWRYNSAILTSPILFENKTKLPIEIAPVFDSNNQDFFKRNQDYPLKKRTYKNEKERVDDIVLFFRTKRIKYLFVEDDKIVNEYFLSFFNKKLYFKNSSLWFLKGVN